jgi:hypothetical protein
VGLRGKGARPLSIHAPGLDSPDTPGRLSHAQEMHLTYGAAPRWAGAFRDRAQYEAAFKLHYERIMSAAPVGRRPLGWWHVEAKRKYPGFDAERAYLYEHQLLGADERIELVACWKRSFERGERDDIPHELWTKWQASENSESPVAPNAKLSSLNSENSEDPAPAA